MPRLREDYEFPNSNARDKYDYGKLFDGQKWQCFAGDDFKVTPQSFSQSLYSAARRQYKIARCKLLSDGSVMVMARDMTDEERAHEDAKRVRSKAADRARKAEKEAAAKSPTV